MSNESITVGIENTEVIFVAEEQSLEDEPPMSEWSSLELKLREKNKKRLLYSQGLYTPGSGEVCAKYIAISDSTVFRHPYYNYPAVTDPGINEAILRPEKSIIYPDDGQELYLALCEEINLCPVRSFYKNLLNDDICLSYYGVNPLGIRPMAIALQYNRSVKRFDLTDNFLDNDACYHLGHMLNSNVTLKELILNGCRIGASGMLRLVEALPGNSALILLHLSRNNIGDEGAAYLAKQISNKATVKQIYLSKNQLGEHAALALAEGIEFNNKITHLDLSWNHLFHTPSIVKLLDVLSQSSLLEELNLAWNALEGERVAEVIKNLMLIPTLRILDLSNNRFQNEAIPLIVDNLFRAKKIVTLDLSFNPLSPKDAKIAIDQMLEPRVRLQNLFLENVNVKKDFLLTLNKVMMMESRQKFTVKYGKVLQNWTVEGRDPREVLLQRANYLGNANKKRKINIGLFFLQVNKEFSKPISVKELMDCIKAERVPLDEDYISELAIIFPGSKSSKTKSINLKQLCEYIERIWPNTKLPPTPPPEPEPEP